MTNFYWVFQSLRGILGFAGKRNNLDLIHWETVSRWEREKIILIDRPETDNPFQSKKEKGGKEK